MIFCGIFFVQNLAKVPVRFIVTDPVHIRLTYLLLAAFFCGGLSFLIYHVSREAKRKNAIKKMGYEDDRDDDDLDDDLDSDDELNK